MKALTVRLLELVSLSTGTRHKPPTRVHTPTPPPTTLAVVLIFMVCLFGPVSRAHGQPPPPPPGTSTHDTNNDGTVDLAIRRLDTDGNGTTDRIHIDSNHNGVIDAGERVFDNVIGFSAVGGAGGIRISIVEDTGTERVETTITPFDKNGDGDCDDAGEIVQSNLMLDSTASIRLRFPNQPVVDVQLGGQSQFDADLNNIVPSGGKDTIPIEIVALSLTSAQPITVKLLQNMPSTGVLVESDNPVPGNLDGQRFAGAGMFDSFFDIFVEIDVQGTRLFNRDPLRLSSLAGIYPPDVSQMFLNLGPVPLFDLTTGQPTGAFLEQFAWTPHTVARVDCFCDTMTVKPVIKTHIDKKKKEVFDSPKATGAIAAVAGVYDIEVTVEWDITITCRGEGDKCVGRYVPTATSADWTVHGKKSAPVGGSESHAGGGVGGNVVCQGKCDGMVNAITPNPTTTYKVSVRKGGGGDVSGKVTGTITLFMNPAPCLKDNWKMILVYESDTDKLEVRIDPNDSDWDGDGVKNVKDKFPLDPSKQK